MKEVQGLIPRDRCVISGQADLEPIETLQRFPVFMGCVDSPAESDLFADMNWMIGGSSGCIQLSPLIPPELVYMTGHNDSTGNVWKRHHAEFAKFVLEHRPTNVLEIGGAHGLLWNEILKSPDSDTSWTIVEPNPEVAPHNRLHIIRGFFEKTQEIPGKFDTVVHSHFFEHTYNPREFMEKIADTVPIGGYQIFSIPDLYYQMANGITSCLNFEHTFLLTDEYVEYLLNTFGFEITHRGEFGNHSRFYAAKKMPRAQPVKPTYSYRHNLSEFRRFLENLRIETQNINKEIAKTTGDIYLFGGHIFTQYLLHFGLDTSRISGILDNSPLKIGRRLYGSPFKVSSPKVLKGRGDATVILKASFYSSEIIQDIRENVNEHIQYIL